MESVEILGQAIILLISLTVLAAASKYVVEKAIRLAKFFRISELAIGFIFVAVMTSLPELSIAVVSSVAGENNLSLGDLLGSNIVNIALVMGLSAAMGLRYSCSRKAANSILVMLLLSLLPLVLLVDGQSSYFDGVVFAVLFAAFVYYAFSTGAIVNRIEEITHWEAVKDFIVFLVSIGVAIISADFAVGSAVEIATAFGMFKSFIGATLVALGTSLPELAINIAAIMKRRGALALGNIVGSNVTNLTLILGINTLINPFAPNLEMAGPIMLFVLITTAVLGFVMWRNRTLRQNDGLVLLGLYVLYLLTISAVQILQL